MELQPEGQAGAIHAPAFPLAFTKILGPGLVGVGVCVCPSLFNEQTQPGCRGTGADGCWSQNGSLVSSRPPCDSSRKRVGRRRAHRLQSESTSGSLAGSHRGFVTHPTCLFARGPAPFPTAGSPVTIFSHLPARSPLGSSGGGKGWGQRIRDQTDQRPDQVRRMAGGEGSLPWNEAGSPAGGALAQLPLLAAAQPVG